MMNSALKLRLKELFTLRVITRKKQKFVPSLLFFSLSLSLTFYPRFINLPPILSCSQSVLLEVYVWNLSKPEVPDQDLNLVKI